MALLAEEGYDPDFGARPVKRAIQRLLLDDLSKALLCVTVDPSPTVVVKADGNHLVFSNSPRTTDR